MTRPAWARVEELYHAALEKHPAEREAFLDQACGQDEDLRREISSLLAHEAEADRLMERPALSAATQKLAVMRGTRLGPYEIQELIGAGGMGEVYRARDTRLGRDVAIKVLPEHVSHDATALARFDREARAVAALSHPHIEALFDIGEHEGTHYLVMDLLEGETLAVRLRRGALPEKDALRIGAEIAEALGAAHAHGIVHRDVKPANVMLTRSGVKLLDFGLARLPRKADASGETATTTGLGEGVVAGTLPYMAPEQLEGREADARADIWALGCVLFEMLTGKRAFEGDSQAKLIAAIEKDEAPSLPAAASSPAVEPLVRKCLEKDPEERFQSARDLAFALKALSGPSGRETARPLRSARLWLPWTALFVAVAAILVAVWLKRPSEAPPVGPFTPITSDASVKVDVALSPDGKHIAFTRTANGQPDLYTNPTDLYVELIGGGEPILVARNACSPAWSPNGREIAFIRHLEKAGEKWNLAVVAVPALGGAERQLTTLGQGDHGLSYSPDGKLLAVTNQEPPDVRPGIFLLSTETGEKRRLTRRPAGNVFGDALPRFSPDGRTVAFVRGKEAFAEDLYLVSVGGGEPRRLTRGGISFFGFDWAPDSRSLVFIAGGVGRAGYTVPSRVSVAGEELPLLGFGEGAIALAVSRQGNRLAYVRSRVDISVWRLDRPTGRGKEPSPVRLIASASHDTDGQYSPDGRQIAFDSFRSGYGEIWTSGRDGSSPRQLTFLQGQGWIGVPRWSPDGREICFSSRKPGNQDIYVVPAAGGIPRQLTTEPSNEFECSWSRDGRWIYFDSSRSGRSELWKAPAGGGPAIQVTRNGGLYGQEGPDGRFLFFTKGSVIEATSPGLWRMPAEGGEEVQVLPKVVLGDFNVVRRGVYHLDRMAQRSPAIDFYDFATGRVSHVGRLPPDYASWALSVSPDERSFLYTAAPPAKTDIVLVENFR